jgi:hypothetical protein
LAAAKGTRRAQGAGEGLTPTSWHVKMPISSRLGPH